MKSPRLRIPRSSLLQTSSSSGTPSPITCWRSPGTAKRAGAHLKSTLVSLLILPACRFDISQTVRCRWTPHLLYCTTPSLCKLAQVDVKTLNMPSFEGMKAYRNEEGTIRLFRPDKNMARMNTVSLLWCHLVSANIKLRVLPELLSLYACNTI